MKTIAALCIFFFSFSIHATETEYSFGVVPQQAASKLARLWAPILKYLGEKSGYQLRFKTAPNIPVFEERILLGEYDFAYMNPYHYTVFHRQPGYQAIARQKDKKIQGIIVVRKDSPIKTLTELADSILAFPAPAAFAASVLPRAYFANENISITAKYVSSHDSVYRTVVKGLYPAGGGIVRTLNNMDPTIQDQLRILWKTQQYTPHAIAVHPRVPRETIKRLQNAMLEMNQDPLGLELLAELNFKGLDLAEDKDWDDVRALGLELLDQLIKQKD